MAKKFETVEERRAYWRQWYQNNKHRPEYKAADYATKKRIRKDRKNWLNEFKSSLSCKRCGINDFRVLDFHHTDTSEKDTEVANMVRLGISKDRILAEISKCECLCANCHRIHHWEERNQERIQHEKD